MYWNPIENYDRYEDISRLTLTWDVLKCDNRIKKDILIMININMRCIEI